mmetsp:Transcript_90103/g.197362  ORF Transcript_90103/g.197362 Transcript_90103/m.197362 type:complete len:713 (+) Transcript_90103:1-2139(+)
MRRTSDHGAYGMRRISVAFLVGMVCGVSSETSAAPSCEETILGLLAGSKTRALAEEMFLLATGGTPPYDAGKYTICQSIGMQSGLKTRFFIANIANWGIMPLPGEVGLCLPAACSNADVQGVVKLLATLVPPFKNASLSTQYVGDQWPAPANTVYYPNPFNEDENRKSWGSGTTAALVVLGALVFLTVLATAATLHRSRVVPTQASRDAETGMGSTGLLETAGTQRRREAKLPKGLAWLKAFSFVGTTGTLTTLFQAEAKRSTDCLDGLKVFSMFFIVLGHSCMEAMDIAGYKNAEDIMKSPLSYYSYSTNAWTYLFLCGQLCVDTFLFISGFLLSFVGMKRSVPVLMGTALRYCRLLPLFGFVMLMYICVVPYFAWGPFSPRLQSDVEQNCQGADWWSQMLFISDWYPWYNRDGGCMGWSWYLSIDMTFAILGMILLNLWKVSKPAGWAAAGLIAAACLGVDIQQSYYHHLDYDVVSPSFAKYAHYLYTRPYLRFPGFCLGLVTPWLLDALSKRGYTPGSRAISTAARMKWFVASLVAVGFLALCIWLPMTNTSGAGPSPPARDCVKNTCWGPFMNAIWISFSRPLWVLGWAILVLACYFGYAPVLNAVLAAPVFKPMSNLTFGAYLVHPMLIKWIAANRTDYYYFTWGDAFGRGTFNFFVAYFLATVTWCLVEKPFATMTGWLVPKKSTKSSGTAAPQEARTVMEESAPA